MLLTDLLFDTGGAVAAAVVAGVVAIIAAGWLAMRVQAMEQRWRDRLAQTIRRLDAVERRVADLAGGARSGAASGASAAPPQAPVADRRDAAAAPERVGPVQPSTAHEQAPPGAAAVTPKEPAPTATAGASAGGAREAFERFDRKFAGLLGHRPSQVGGLASAPPAEPTNAADAAASAAAAEKSGGATLEERLGSKVFVWVGGVALALAGAFLVKYSVENAVLPPAARVVLGAVLGLGLLGGAEWARPRANRIAQALAGAGVADLFGCLLAATTLYGLIGPTLAFALMVGLTAGAVALSLRHGPFVALLGLIGGFVTPAVIGGEDPAMFPLLAYLLLLEIGMVAIARRRGWFGLTGLTLAGAVLWSVVLALAGGSPAERVGLQFFLIASGAVYVVGATGFEGERPTGRLGKTALAFQIAMGSLFAAVALLGALAFQSPMGVMDFVMLGLLGAGLLALARFRPAYGPMACLAGAASALVLAAWAGRNLWDGGPDAGGFWLALVASFGALYAGGAYAALWRSGRAGYWAAGSAAAAVGFVLVGWLGLPITRTPHWLSWWWVAGGLGLIYGVAAIPVRLGRSGMAGGEAALGALTLGSTVLLALAAFMGLDHPWHLTGWAGLAAVNAGLFRSQRIVGAAAASTALGALTAGGLLFPGVLGIKPGDLPVFNAVLPAYAMPAVALGLASWWMRGRRSAVLGAVQRQFSLGIGALGVLLLIRHGFHPGPFGLGPAGLTEWATYAIAALALAHGLVYWDRCRPGWPQRSTAIALLGVAGFAAVLGAGLLENPLWTDAAVTGWPVLNTLLYVYGLPAALAGSLAYLGRGWRQAPPHLVPALGAAAMLGVLTLTVAVVRHGFHGQAMDGAAVTLFEWATHAAVLLGLAHAALWAERRWPGEALQAGAGVFAVLGAAAAVVGAGLLANPLWPAEGPTWRTEAVGSWPILNGLLYVYGLPAVLVATLPRSAASRLVRPRLRLAAGLTAIGLVFALVSLQVRQAFAGSVLSETPVSMAEWYTYSLVWVLLGLTLLGGGLRFGSAALRYGSLIVMLLAIGKVFVLDTSRLEDLYRVLSLLGLGFSLIALGYVYQRFVFRRPVKAEDES